MLDVTLDGDEPAETAQTTLLQKRGIAKVTGRKRPVKPAVPTTPGGDELEGGKRGQPVSPPSNAEFLAHVMRGIAGGASAAVCSKAGDPTSGGWLAEAVSDVDRQCPVDRNNYVNCSSFVTDGAGDIEAKKERFRGFHFLVLDDVGTKVASDRLTGFEPTWEIETSPGNSQIGILLTQPIDDAALVKRLQDAVIAAGLCDPGAGGVARWVRLPHAINGKPKYRGADGKAFNCRLVRWNPSVTYTVDRIVEVLGWR